MKENKKPINVGRINHGKLVGVSSQSFWELDQVLCITIRDLLRSFVVKNKVSFPADLIKEDCVQDKYNLTEEEEEKLRIKWCSIINDIADKFDYYIKHEGYDGNKEALQKLKEGCDLLAEWMPYLWW